MSMEDASDGATFHSTWSITQRIDTEKRTVKLCALTQSYNYPVTSKAIKDEQGVVNVPSCTLDVCMLLRTYKPRIGGGTLALDFNLPKLEYDQIREEYQVIICIRSFNRYDCIRRDLSTVVNTSILSGPAITASCLATGSFKVDLVQKKYYLGEQNHSQSPVHMVMHILDFQSGVKPTRKGRILLRPRAFRSLGPKGEGREGWLAFARDATLARAQGKGSQIHWEGERGKGTRAEERRLSISQMSRSFADFRNTRFHKLFAESALVGSRHFAAKWFRRSSQGRRKSSQFAVRKSLQFAVRKSSQFAVRSFAVRSSQISQGRKYHNPSGLGKAAWPRREAGSLRGLSAASYRLCSTSRTIWRHSASFLSANTVRSWAQHVREGEGSGAETHRGPSVQVQVLQPVKEGRQLASDAECSRERWWLRRRSSVFAGGVVCSQGNRMCSRDAPDQDGREMQRGSH
ncbi:hypothetical protein C8Q73DRAFT_662298 [Cubamyces lactineus]|nr:hypothetical protein C8Q73DRAFT_662298 [Cubamyces lactineus]